MSSKKENSNDDMAEEERKITKTKVSETHIYVYMDF